MNPLLDLSRAIVARNLPRPVLMLGSHMDAVRFVEGMAGKDSLGIMVETFDSSERRFRVAGFDVTWKDSSRG